MDLGTVGKKLKSFSYNSKKEFLDDLNLIWSNCFQYNVIEGNIYVVYAEHMKGRTELLAEKIPDVIVHSKDDCVTENLESPMQIEDIKEEKEIQIIEEKIEDPIPDENSQVNQFREIFFEKRMNFVGDRKNELVKPCSERKPIQRLSKKMGDYALSHSNADFFPEIDFFSDSFPSLPQIAFCDKERLFYV